MNIPLILHFKDALTMSEIPEHFSIQKIESVRISHKLFSKTAKVMSSNIRVVSPAVRSVEFQDGHALTI